MTGQTSDSGLIGSTLPGATLSGPIPFIISFSISTTTINWAKGDLSKVGYYPISISLSPNGHYAIILIPAQGSRNLGYVQVYDQKNFGTLISSISYQSITPNTESYSPNSNAVLINSLGNAAYFIDRYIKGSSCYGDKY